MSRSPTDHTPETETQISTPSTQGSGSGNQLAKSTEVPVWSGFNSLVSDTMPVTWIGAPPLIAAPAHEWQTLLTVLMHAHNITTKVVGPTRKTVISLDMGLYQPAMKLQMARQDLKHTILHPGELHVVMAQLRTIGVFMENSGLDLWWIELELYGPATVKQIINGKHVKRGETAHMITLQELFALYQKAVFQQDPSSYRCLEELAKQLCDACIDGFKEQLKEVHHKVLQNTELLQIIEKMNVFDAKQDKVPLFKVMHQYMRMVMEMMSFIHAIRSGDWALHLEVLEVLFARYFFAHGMLNYARMIPVYLVEMQMLHESDPEIYAEFKQGNWVVNKNLCVPFCAIGPDNALEHVNQSMKVSDGLVGITLNPKARTKYFLIAPELARLAEQAKQMAVSSSTTTKDHHTHATAVRLLQEKNIQQLTSLFKASRIHSWRKVLTFSTW